MVWSIGYEVEHAIQGRAVPYQLQEGFAYRRAAGRIVGEFRSFNTFTTTSEISRPR